MSLIGDPDVRQRAAERLARLGPSGIESLIEILKRDEIMRPIVAQALVIIGSPAVEPLVKVQQTRKHTRKIVIEVLERIDDPKAIEHHDRIVKEHSQTGDLAESSPLPPLCWFCGRRSSDKVSNVKPWAYKVVKRDLAGVSEKRVATVKIKQTNIQTTYELPGTVVVIPRCSTCDKMHKWEDRLLYGGALLGFVIGIGSVLITAIASLFQLRPLGMGEVLLMIVVGGAISALPGGALGLIMGRSLRLIQRTKSGDLSEIRHPTIDRLQEQGYEMKQRPLS